MKTLLMNFQMFITIGMAVIVYFWLMNWSVKWFVEFRLTYKERKNYKMMDKRHPVEYSKRYNITKYDWQEIVSIPVYILAWTPVLLFIVALIGGFFYVLYDLFRVMLTLVS